MASSSDPAGRSDADGNDVGQVHAAPAIVEEDHHGVVAFVGDRQINEGVSIEVADGHGAGRIADGDCRHERREGAQAVV